MTQINQLVLHPGEDFIELYKVLKVQGMSNAGGEAKHVIDEGLVTVNGEVETRKRKKSLRVILSVLTVNRFKSLRLNKPDTVE